MTMDRRQFLQMTGVSALCSLAARPALALDYPTRPVRLIVGFPASSGPDLVARLIGNWLSERLGQSFVIENRPGAGSNVATEVAVRAPADGYTLLLASVAVFSDVDMVLRRAVKSSRVDTARTSMWPILRFMGFPSSSWSGRGRYSMAAVGGGGGVHEHLVGPRL